MSDFGIKITKIGKQNASQNINDHVFWSKYPPLSLLEKKTITLTATSSVCGAKTREVPHGYNFFPLVLGIVEKTGGNPTADHQNRYFIPADNFTGINCDAGTTPVLTFDLKVKKNTVEIVWEANCVLMGSESCPLTTQTFTVDLYFYLWELGSKYPL